MIPGPPTVRERRCGQPIAIDNRQSSLNTSALGLGGMCVWGGGGEEEVEDEEEEEG